ncbi:MAG: ABC transporter permease, partial [Chloroflexota bacterium]|nr:ABC transporter permease [Chloroflexota bacterium]
MQPAISDKDGLPTPDSRLPTPSPPAPTHRLVYWLLNLWGLIKVAWQRQRSHLGLVLALVVGFVVAVALVVSIPLYADAVGYRILRTELQSDATGMRRPPFAYMFSRSLSANQPASLDAYRKADQYFISSGARDLGLPAGVVVHYAATDKLRLLPSGSAGAQAAEPLMWVSLGFARDLEPKVEVVEGAPPRPADGGDRPVDVMINERMADKLGVQVGEEYLVLEKGTAGNLLRAPVRIASVWRPRNADDPYWFYRPESLEDVLMVPEQTFKTSVLNQGPRALYQALWYLVLDGSEVRSRHVPPLIARMAATERRADSLLPGTELRISPRQALERQWREVRFLTVSLVVFSIPILLLIAYFIFMVASMVVQRQQNEIAVLRSRGVSRGEVLGIYVLEGLGLGLAALALGVFLGRYAAVLMGWTRSFLLFVPRGNVPVEVSPESIRSALSVVGLTLVASLVPALGAAGHTIISYKQERARALGRPWWQRHYLDLLLLIPAYYGYRQLRDRGTIQILGRTTPAGGVGGGDDPFTNPLLVLTPALWLLALALLSARIFPFAMGLAGSIASRLPGVSGVLALRYLTRTPRAYTGPVLLLILTLSLAAFTASMAKTLDTHLDDQIHYSVGADMRVTDLGQSTEESSVPGAPAAPAGNEQQRSDEPQWLFLPVTEYLRIPGVVDATRVSRSETVAAVGRGRQPGTVLGIDRVDFPAVAHWRHDYAPQPLGALMNVLAANDNGLLASRGFMAQQGLEVGARIILQLHDLEEARSVPFAIVGMLDYFPTLYPEDGAFFVANLDYLFQQQGGEFPYEVWLDVAPGTTKEQIERGVRDLGLRSIVSDEAPPLILSAQERPERQGLYGLLSVGFLASALLTGLGFLFYSVTSFQRRFIELGML